MGRFRRSRDAADVDPDDDIDLEVDPDDGEIDEEMQGPLGPTGRPLHPVGAYFEAAFRRFGINILGYSLYTIMCGLLPIGAALIVSAATLPEWLGLFIFFLGFTLGNVLLIALTTALVSGGGVVFTGNQTGYALALDDASGEVLWKFQTGSAVRGQPVTWKMDGRQYVAMPSGGGGIAVSIVGQPTLDTPGSALVVFALPAAK